MSIWEKANNPKYSASSGRFGSQNKLHISLKSLNKSQIERKRRQRSLESTDEKYKADRITAHIKIFPQ